MDKRRNLNPWLHLGATMTVLNHIFGFYLFYFIYLFMAVLSFCCCEDFFSSYGEWASLWYAGFSLWWLFLLQGTHCRACRLSSCGSRALEQGSVVVAHRLSCSRACGSSQIRDWTHVSCIGRQILYHWATREIPHVCFRFPVTYSQTHF